jgi:diguanylate cyclase (GGDEF)-like protein
VTPRAPSLATHTLGFAHSWAWLGVLAAGFALAALAVGAASSPVTPLATAACGGLLVIATIAGLRWHRPARRRPWILVAAGLGLYWLGATPPLAGLWERDALLTQVVTVAGYVALLAGIVDVLGDGAADGDLSTLLEALTLAAAAALVVWFLLIAPVRVERSVTFGDALGALAYPALDLALFAVAGRALLCYRRIGTALWLLLPALIASAATDFAGLFAFADGTTPSPWLALGGSLLGTTFVAAAALHPSLRRPLLAEPRPMSSFLRIRAPLVGAAALLGPVLMLISDAHSELKELPEVGLGALLISGLVVADLYLLLFRLDGALHARIHLESELQRQAQSDSLTDLPNRGAFIGRLTDVLRGERRQVALLFCDLDDFKTVNDTLGHAAGDQLLIEVGQRLRAAIRPTDLAARLGGDEFAVLLTGIAHRDDADRVAARILQAFTAPFRLDGLRFGVRISIGIAFGEDAADRSALMRDADIAMYLAKGRGKGRFERFRPDALAESTSALAMQSTLEQAIATDGLQVAFQPVHDLASGSIVGVEALARWQHPTLGSIPPVEFIRLAEQSGLIVPLGRQVLRDACRQMRAWLDDGVAPDTDLYVNVSAVQLADPSFADDVGEIVRATGLPPGRLVVEVTETALVDAPQAIATFTRLKALGVRVAIDDFGTGYSSISYLGQFPTDVLKIDRSFVSALGETRKGDSLVRMIVALGSSLGLATVAEGIETVDQVEALLEMGCRFGQGYFLSRPGAARDLDGRLPRAAVAA